MDVFIRRVQAGDGPVLAYIQTESWKAAFQNILEKEILDRCTDMDRAAGMYQKLLEEEKGHGYLMILHGQPHGIAWWDAARDPELDGKAELICIHSLPQNWGKGYGSILMDRVLADMKGAGFSEGILWVFVNNARARRFYEAKGFFWQRSAGNRHWERRKCAMGSPCSSAAISILPERIGREHRFRCSRPLTFLNLFFTKWPLGSHRRLLQYLRHKVPQPAPG